MSDDYLKVWVYCLGDSRDVYAWTTDKKISKRFESERDMRLYKKEVFYLDDDRFSVFAYKHSASKIIHDVLTDDNNEDFEIMCTGEESMQLDECVEQIETFFGYIEEECSFYMMKNKYVKLIRDITSSIVVKDLDSTSDKTVNVTSEDKIPTLNYLRINTLTLFYKANARAFGLRSFEEDYKEEV